MKIIVKDYSIRGRHFTIVRNDNGMYCAVEDKFIKNGKTTQVLYANNLHPGATLEDCLNYTKDAVEVDYLVEQGMSRAEAFCTYWGNMEMLDKVKELVGEE